MRKSIILIFIFINLSTYSQTENNFLIKINDSLIVKKKCQEAIRLNISLEKKNISIQNFIFYKFNKYVPTNIFLFNEKVFKVGNKIPAGLFFYIEDIDENIIQPKGYRYISYKNPRDELNKPQSIQIVDTMSLKIKSKKVSYENKHLYDFGKIYIDKKNNSLALSVFPIIDKYYTLNKGEYYLTLFYSFFEAVGINSDLIGIVDSEKSEEEIIFEGYIKSNRVKLIIQ